MRSFVGLFLTFLLAAMLTGCGEERYNQMRSRMAAVDSLNRHYQPFSVDTVREMADYFDSHGTPHDRTMAYYLLGSAYRDAGEAPAALDAFQQAAILTDTTDIDCDYRLLAKIHYQIGMLFLNQYLPLSAKNEIQTARNYALTAKDTLMSLDYERFVLSAYNQLQMRDSVLWHTHRIASELRARGDTVNAARTLFIAVSLHIADNDYEEAEQLLRVYERDGHIYDEQGNVSQGLLLYLYYRGLCHLHHGERKEAEHCFRQLSDRSCDIEQTKGGYDGLRRLYMMTNDKDSAMKYTMLYADANDTCYARQSRNEMTTMSGLYNYERYQRLSEKQSAELASSKMYIILITSFFVILALIGALTFFIRIRNKQHELMKKQLELQKTQIEIDRLEREIEELKSQGEDNQTAIQTKETEIALLKRRLLAYRPKNDILPDMKKMARNGISLSIQEWKEIETYMEEEDPLFIPRLQHLCNSLTTQEFRICLLTRLRFDVAEIANLLDTSSAVVSKSRKHLMIKIFNDNSGTKRFNYRVFGI